MVVENDGVAICVRGDLLLSVWSRPARVHRTRWFFDMVDEAVAASPEGLVAMLVILDTASPPDAPARHENTERLRKLGGALRRVVSVPVGDAVFSNVVASVMRAMFVVTRQARVQIVESTLPLGIRRVMDVATPRTPDRAQIERDLGALFSVLQVPSPVQVLSV